MTSAESAVLDALESLNVPATSRGRRLAEAGRGRLLSVLRSLIDERIAEHLKSQGGVSPDEVAKLPLGRSEDGEFLSAKQMAQALKVSVQTVRNLESNDILFSLLAPLRQRGRVYPAYLVEYALSGTANPRLLQTLERLGGEHKHLFLTTPRDTLAGLTPLTLWMGRAGLTGITAAQSALLRQSQPERERLVLRQALASVHGDGRARKLRSTRL